MNHKHRVKTRVERGFTHPVAWPENRSAHGNITRVDTCSCGAIRSTNINGNHIERGQWKAKGTL